MTIAGRFRAILLRLAHALLCPLALALLCPVALALLCPGGAVAAPALDLGFNDGFFTGPDPAPWLHRSVEAGADLVRIDIGWTGVAPIRRPPGFDARNPGDPAYNFAHADSAIRLAHEQGLRILVLFTGAPTWAQAPGAPARTPVGTWRPQPRAIEDYGAALAQRYSGHYPDPLHPGRKLPRAAAFQLWNEPNLSQYLNPQWSGGRMASPVIYRQMLNAFYKGVKSVDPSDVVVSAGTAPFGDPFPNHPRIMPVPFWQDLLCLRQVRQSLSAVKCPDPAHFDVLAHQPYSIGAPGVTALEPGDVAIADIGKLTRLLRAAERTGGTLPRIHHPVWVTEVGYNTKPPNPAGVPSAEDARWIEQTLEILWRQGVAAVYWSQLADEAPHPSYAAADESGVYFHNGKPKLLALEAFRFPLVASRVGPAHLEIWGRTPVGGRLHIEQFSRSGWRTVRTLTAGAGSTFLTFISERGRASVRARVGGRTSLVWRVA